MRQIHIDETSSSVTTIGTAYSSTLDTAVACDEKDHSDYAVAAPPSALRLSPGIRAAQEPRTRR